MIDDILSLYKQRLTIYGPLHSKMKMIQSIYNGTMEVPLPDMEQNSMPSVPNLLATGVDQMAGRITSVIPAVNFSSLKPGTRSALAVMIEPLDGPPPAQDEAARTAPHRLRHVPSRGPLGQGGQPTDVADQAPT